MHMFLKANCPVWFVSLGCEGLQEVWPCLNNHSRRSESHPWPSVATMLSWCSEARILPEPLHLWLSVIIPTSSLNKSAVDQRPLDGSCGKMCHTPQGFFYTDCEHIFQAKQNCHVRESAVLNRNKIYFQHLPEKLGGQLLHTHIISFPCDNLNLIFSIEQNGNQLRTVQKP